MKEDYNSQSKDCIDLISKIRSDLNDATEKIEWFERECQDMIDGELDVYGYDLDDYASDIYKDHNGFYYQLGQWMSKFRDIDIDEY